VVLVAGAPSDAEALWGEVTAVQPPLGQRLSAEKSRVCHINERSDFLGFRIQQRINPGTSKRYVYTWPSKKSLDSITDKVLKLTHHRRHKTLATRPPRSTPSDGDGATICRTACPNAPSSTSITSPSGGGRLVAQRHAGLNWGTFSRRHLPNGGVHVASCSDDN
jgi:RNA-directed DNA polymerase